MARKRDAVEDRDGADERADEGHRPPDRDAIKRFGKLVGASPAMRDLFSLLARAAASDSTVLIEGETGTGKEVTAQAIHDASERRDGPFVVIDCGAIPGQLLESELFGYQKGAFTGASNSRAGAFEAASGGSIFLDEIGELDLDLQPKLLRVLESRTVKRVGTTHYAPVDVRVLAATNRSLRYEVKEGRFRSDLFYRLAVVHVKLPPLRDRLQDLPLLTSSILKQLGVTGNELQELVVESDLEEQLARCSWPGNIRQLRNYLEQRVALGSSIPPPTGDSLLPYASAHARPPPSLAFPPPPSPLLRPTAPAPPPALSMPEVAFELPLKAARDQWNSIFELRYLEELLRRHSDNVTAAAKAAGVNRVHLYRLLWKHGLRESEAK